MELRSRRHMAKPVPMHRWFRQRHHNPPHQYHRPHQEPESHYRSQQQRHSKSHPYRLRLQPTTPPTILQGRKTRYPIPHYSPRRSFLPPPLKPHKRRPDYRRRLHHLQQPTGLHLCPSSRLLPRHQTDAEIVCAQMSKGECDLQ